MKKAKFQIGDLVNAGLCGKGEVTDIMYSASKDRITYEVKCRNGESFWFSEENLKPVPKTKDYRVEIRIDIARNVVIASLYENEDKIMKPVAKGHGHMIHEGDVGIAQAASYACLQLYRSLRGGKK